MHNRVDRMTRLFAGVLATFVTAFTLGAQALEAQQFASATSPEREVTFSNEVVRILQENCQVCHQPGGIGPMSLMTYQDVRRWIEPLISRSRSAHACFRRHPAQSRELSTASVVRTDHIFTRLHASARALLGAPQHR